MKATKSILVVLFVLLMAQIASAYYCPSTGRWLSRDPLGEQGFQVMQVPQMPNPIQQQAVRWIERDPATLQQTANPYAFLGNKPIRQTDLLGMVGSVPVSLMEAIASGDVAQVEAILAGLSEDDAGYALAKAWLQKVAACDALHAAYDALKCVSCKACTTKEQAEKNALCLSTEIALRQAFINKKCDYCLAGSINGPGGSAKAAAGHEAQVAQLTVQLLFCTKQIGVLPSATPPSSP
jgi:hypothetical protein